MSYKKSLSIKKDKKIYIFSTRNICKILFCGKLLLPKKNIALSKTESQMTEP